MRSAATVSVSLLVLGLLVPLAAQGQQSSDDLARAHFMSGSAYYEQARYEDAARAFMEAYRLSPRAQLLENAARAYERALLFDEAIETLRTMRASHPEYRDEATVADRIANLERLRERVRVGGGGGGGGGDAAPAPATGGGGSGTGGGGSVSIPGIAVLAGGGALGIVSIITGAVSHSMFEELRTACDANGGICPNARAGDIDTGEALAITSTVTMFASIAAIGVGVVLLIVDTGGGSSDQAAVRLTPGPGDVGLGMQARF